MTVHDPDLTPTFNAGRTIVEALGGQWTPRGGMCRCPAHADRSPSLSVRPGRTRLLFHCFAGCATRDVLRALASLHLATMRVGAPSAEVTDAQHRGLAAAQRLWADARPLSGTIAARYLAGRGVAATAALRFHPRAPCGRKPLTRFIPAVTDKAGLVAIHRTFLSADGSTLAQRPPSRAALGTLGTGLVRLSPAGDVLGLAEGIETALSATALFGVPCWATLGTERFQRVRVPSAVRRLILFLDNDAAGRRAETLARTAFAGGPSFEVRYPPNPGEDWNDVVRAQMQARSAPVE